MSDTKPPLCACDFLTHMTVETDPDRPLYLLPAIRELAAGPVDGVRIYRSGECQWRVELVKDFQMQVITFGSDSRISATTEAVARARCRVT